MYKYAYNGKEPFLIIALLLLSFFLSKPINVSAQVLAGTGYKVSLAEAVQFAKSQNKWLLAANIGQDASAEDRKDAYRNALPTVNASASYQRFSGLTLFTEGLNHANTGPRKPSSNSATLGIDALFNIYSGGKQRAFESEANSRLSLAKLNTREQAGNIALQTANQYLELLRLYDLRKFIGEQLKRAQTRLNNIRSLYKNQKVTRSDVLRAEVASSNVALSLEQNENNISIANQKLDVLINVPDSVMIIPADSAGMRKPDIASLLPLVGLGDVSSYPVQRVTENIGLQAAKLKGIQSGNLPSFSLYAAYGLNYPNYLFFPPVDQAYSIGFIGLKVQYSISSIYQNRSKLTASKLRVKELEVQKEAYRDDARILLKSYAIRYAEALKRISVNEHSVAQAQVNYKIVNTKYLNQLSLLTDLLDADNLYQESRFNLVKAQTDALAIYYHILYSSGNL
ncbi:TolC family protein [Pedobacter psychrodurus]|uniref:TolC family protein n=1 Tax=Pedobacter psychrodurus TaxID=2530456 RepID=UPI00292EAA4B|nr:TolC family protein [Pedobacter psychrodurus]